MKKLLSAVLLAAAVSAQPPSAPPPIIRVTTKPGSATGPTRPYSTAKAAVDVLGVAASTGLPQTWMIEMHDTFGSIEDVDNALSAVGGDAMPGGMAGDTGDDLIAPPRTMIAVYDPDWSYRPEDAMRQLPKARYLRVTVHRIRVGLEAEFQELVRLRKLTNASINLDRPEMAYQVISGAPHGTYLILSPIATLRTMDEGVADIPAFAIPVAEARAKAAPKAADIEISRENLLFRVEPRLSYVSDDFASADKSFWRGKPSR